jgi:hypothetical protein
MRLPRWPRWLLRLWNPHTGDLLTTPLPGCTRSGLSFQSGRTLGGQRR